MRIFLKISINVLLLGSLQAQGFFFFGSNVGTGGGGGGGSILVSSVCGPASPPGSGNGGVSAAIDTTGADLLVYAVSAAGSSTPSDSKGNTWTNPSVFFGSGPGIYLYYAQNPATVGPGHTFTNGAAGGSYPGICVLAFKTMQTSTVYNSDAVGTAVSATTIQAASLTPPSGHQVIISALSLNAGNGVTATIDSGFDTPIGVPQGANDYGIYLSWYEQVSGAGVAKQPTWTVSSGGTIKTFTASFKGQ
jgi:hypothetical protein